MSTVSCDVACVDRCWSTSDQLDFDIRSHVRHVLSAQEVCFLGHTWDHVDDVSFSSISKPRLRESAIRVCGTNIDNVLYVSAGARGWGKLRGHELLVLKVNVSSLEVSNVQRFECLVLDISSVEWSLPDRRWVTLYMDTRYVSGVGRETFELCTTIIRNEVPSYEITLSNRCSFFFFFFLFFFIISMQSLLFGCFLQRSRYNRRDYE